MLGNCKVTSRDALKSAGGVVLSFEHSMLFESFQRTPRLLLTIYIIKQYLEIIKRYAEASFGGKYKGFCDGCLKKKFEVFRGARIINEVAMGR